MIDVIVKRSRKKILQMKKIQIYILILSILVTGLISCIDNENFSVLHNLTDEEIAEIARQKAYDDSIRNHIDADLLLDYTLSFKISATLYDGAPVEIDVNAIAELFGISSEQLLAGIAGEDGAPEIKGFGIAGSTHIDIATASNTNAPWGHWWDINGDLTQWGDNAMVFAEFDTENGVFNVGQYPGHLSEGDTITFIEGLKYDTLRAAVRIKVIPTMPEGIVATVVNTQNLSINVVPKNVYDADPLDFDLDKTLSDLGVTSMEEVAFIGVNADGTYAQDAVTGNGFWYDAKGFVSSWGAGGVTYTNYGDFEANQVSIGQFPDSLYIGESFSIQYGFLANKKIEMLKIRITVIDPSTVPGEPKEIEKSYAVNEDKVTDYSSTDVDITEDLAEAFALSLGEITTAIANQEMVFSSVNKDGSVISSSTANYPGYWYNINGDVCSWGAEAIVYSEVHTTDAALLLAIGHHPENTAVGDVVTFTQIAELNGGKVTFTVTVKITDPDGGGPKTVEKTFDIEEAYNPDYTPTSVDVTDILADAFNMTVADINAAIGNQELVFSGVNADGTVYVDGDGNPVSTANYPGNWFDINGNVCSWGAESIIYCELGHDDTLLQLNVGHHPTSAKAGDQVTFKQIAELNGGKVTFTINVKIL